MSPDVSPHRRKGYLALTTILITVAATVLALPVLAVNATGAFELDGNASSSTTNPGPPDDWDRVCHQAPPGGDCSTTFNTNGAAAVEFASQTASGGTTFTGGGSKDPIDVSSWAWNQASGGLPGKDVLLNGFAARYNLSTNPSCPSGPCNMLFFGMDRFDNAGDAQNGFWFFQNAIGLGNVKSGGGQTFTGVHSDGDLLVVSDFSIGGTTSTISVYVWNHACTAAGKPTPSCADSNLQLLQSSTTANCATSSATASFCGIVNPTAGTTAPWPFTDKKGNTTFDQGEFYEGGINLTKLGLGGECFASTLAESRSSTATSAVLKSFVLGGFGSCTSSITTVASDPSGNPLTSAPIGTGLVSVADSATVTVGGVATWIGSVDFHLCGPNAGNCTTGGTDIGSVPVTNATVMPILSATATVSSVGSYCWRGDFTSSTPNVPPASDDGLMHAVECFTVNPVPTALSTQAANSTTVQLGNPISDTATLSGTANQPGTPIINGPLGPAAGGSITFQAFGPNPSATVCGVLAFTSSAVPVSGDATYGAGVATFTPATVGTYTWVATYTPDISGNTLGSQATACPDPTGHENVTVTDTTNVTTAQDWLPNDTATISSAGGSPLSGTVTFTLYNNGTCNTTNPADVLYTNQQTLTNATSPQVLHTSNTTVKVSASAIVSWRVTFSSTGGNVAGSTSNCETTTLTISN